MAENPVGARFRKAIRLVIDDVVEEHRSSTNDYEYNRRRLLQDALENYIPNFWLRVGKYEEKFKGEDEHAIDNDEN